MFICLKNDFVLNLNNNENSTIVLQLSFFSLIKLLFVHVLS